MKYIKKLLSKRYLVLMLAGFLFGFVGLVTVSAHGRHHGDWNEYPTPTFEVCDNDDCVTPEVTVEPTASPSAEPTVEVTQAPPPAPGGDGKSDNRSDGLCSKPPCVKAPVYDQQGQVLSSQTGFK